MARPATPDRELPAAVPRRPQGTDRPPARTFVTPPRAFRHTHALTGHTIVRSFGRTMPTHRSILRDRRLQELGAPGEQLDAEQLERLGFRVLARNHRTHYGELDLVATDPGGAV